jgi:DNA polymerase III subunit epsilon
MRQLAVQTEPTGLDPSEGHRIVEIGCVEIVNGRLTGHVYHVYINPEREIDEYAARVHGITRSFLDDKPYFSDIAGEFLEFVKGAELLIHNAPFDVTFINHELAHVYGKERAPHIEDYCTITDTLVLARQLHPGRKNDLDSLCQRYKLMTPDRAHRTALTDADALAHVFLAMKDGG